jgi:hypothetical protein
MSEGAGSSAVRVERPVYFSVIDAIDQMNWELLTADEIMRVAKAYYYFSVQFRENLTIACRLYPDDEKLKELWAGECDTANLSPFPDIAQKGERMNHDEFMRRLLECHLVGGDEGLSLVGQAYLNRTRKMSDAARAASIASYENGGLSTVFHAMLRAKAWHGMGQRAFRFFLRAHIGFDGDGGHGSLCEHIPVDDKILPLWVAFCDLLIFAVPKLTE